MLVALLPPLCTSWHVLRNAVNVPFWDHWALASLMVTQAQERLDWSELAAPHNGHRILLPRLAFLGLSALSSWDVRWEQAASLAFAAASLALLALLVRRTVRVHEGPLVLAASVLTFSLIAWENWSWGFQLQVAMVGFFAVLTAWLASVARGRARDVLAMLLAASGGAFSFAAGLVLYPLVLGAVLLVPAALPSRRRALQALLVAVVMVAVGGAYVSGSPPATISDAAGLQLGRYALAFLGGTMGSVGVAWGQLLGLLVVAAWAACSLLLWKRAPALRGRALPWIMLGGFALGSALLTALARSGMGLEQALVPRYVTLSTPLWIATLALGALLLGASSASPGRRSCLAVWAITLVAIGAQIARGSVQGVRCLEAHASNLRYAAALLTLPAGPPPGSLEFLLDDARVRERLPALRAQGLSVYARPRPLPALEDFERVTPAPSAGALEVVAVHPEHGPCVKLAGWAVDPDTGRAPEHVLIAVHGAVLAQVAPERPEGDGAPARFEHHFRACSPHMVGAPLEVFAVLSGRRLLPLAPARPFLRERAE